MARDEHTLALQPRRQSEVYGLDWIPRFVVWTEHPGLWFGLFVVWTEHPGFWFLDWTLRFVVWTEHLGLWFELKYRLVVSTQHSGLWFGLNPQVCHLTKTFCRKRLWFVVPFVSSDRWEHFSRSVQFGQPDELLFTHSSGLWLGLKTQVCGLDGTFRFVVWTEHSGLCLELKHRPVVSIQNSGFVVSAQHSGLWFELNPQVCGLD